MPIGIPPDATRGPGLVDNSWLNAIVTGQNIATYLESSATTTQFGSSTGFFPDEGNLNRQISAAGVQPGSTGNDNVLAFYGVPALGFDQSGRGLQITAAGSFGATGNNKTIKILAGAVLPVIGSAAPTATTIATTGVVTTNGNGWEISANVFKYGGLGSNTQIAIHSQAQVGAAVSALQVPTLLTLTEAQIIYLMITGNAATAVTDIIFNWLEINAMN